MSAALSKINMAEAAAFYKSPHSLVDYTQMQSFSLIKSVIEVFAYYKASPFTAEDIRDFFSELQLVQAKTNRVFLPSPRKIRGVLDLYLSPGPFQLAMEGEAYAIVSWDCSGYYYAVQREKEVLQSHYNE